MSKTSISNISYKYDYEEIGAQIHNYMEIIYVLSGRLAIFYSGKNYVLQTEDFVVINPFVSHELYKEKGCHTVSFLIDIDYLRKYNIQEIDCNTKTSTESRAIASIRKQLALLLADMVKDDAINNIYIESKLLGLLGILSTSFSTATHENTVEDRADKMHDVLIYIHNNYQTKCNAADIAKHFFMSQGYFSKLFEKHMGVSFSSYLRELRLSHGQKLLLTSKMQVVDISEECGFENVNTFINSFKNKYNETPNQYRKKHYIEENLEEKYVPDKKDRTQLYSLLKYVPSSNDELNQSHVVEKKIEVVNRCAEKESACTSLFSTLNMGYAIGLIAPKAQDIIRTAKKEFDYKYLYIQGVFDEEMAVFFRDPEGNILPRYRILDQVIDIILDNNMIPWIELSRTPSELLDKPTNVFHDGFVQLPDDLDSWLNFVRMIFEHYIEKYGESDVSKWRVSIFPGLYISYNLFSFEEYFEYYQRTYITVKSKLPMLQICGGIFDIRLLQASWNQRDNDLIVRFLRKAKENNVTPDILGIQCFSVDYSLRDVKETEKRIVESSGEIDPVTPTADADSLKHDNRLIKDYLKQSDVDIPVAYISWNSSIWYRDLGNDTCFKSAYLVKNALENCSNIETLCYSMFNDVNDEEILFGGGYGLLTENMIPKADYYSLQLLKRISNAKIIENGDGYCFLEGTQKDELYLMLYHYCHYDLNLRIEELVSREEQRSIDRYYAFLDDGTWNVHVTIKNLKEGIWTRQDTIVDRTNGSSFDKWIEMGAPNTLDEYQRNYLINSSRPRYFVHEEMIKESMELCLNLPLDPHEVRLIQLNFKG